MRLLSLIILPFAFFQRSAPSSPWYMEWITLQPVMQYNRSDDPCMSEASDNLGSQDN
jgi:hypothetical protein